MENYRILNENICFYVRLELVLKQEQEEYQREGIEWTNIDYFNNQVSFNINFQKKRIKIKH